ncbi:MAG: glycosyltransferase family 2 protein [Chloroflexia bacterium]
MFIPWLLWCFDRQTWPRRELVIVDSSPEPCHIVERDGPRAVRVVPAPPGSGVASKRNLALREAAGEFVAWFDDDDWQHPERLALLVEALRSGAVCAGSRRAWFVDLTTRRCEAYAGFKGRVVFNSALFSRETAQKIAFQENLRSASDTPWMASLMSAHPGGVVLLDRQDLFFWLCHSTNLSNSARRKRFSEPLGRLKTLVGSEAWGDTSEALDALHNRLAQSAPVQTGATLPKKQPIAQLPQETRVPTAHVLQARSRSDNEAKDPVTPVAAMVKATVLDAPYLGTMVRHMLSQARYPFTERVVVVDRRVDFSGKYQHRPRLGQQALDRVLEGLLDDRVIDAVHDVDIRPQVITEIMGRYFVEQAGRVPTHASTGGPIYATLFGLETMSCDYVVQMDADMFFHTGPQGWVKRALSLMQDDPQLWLMMTHPGPPAGPPGSSLGRTNSPRATWDSDLYLWRFRQATTRYFLCDRRRIRNRLSPIFQAGGCAPLEQCISQALQRYGASRGALGDLESWHLHAWYHGDPFPRWALALVELVERGSFPDLQRGEYDLRLDREMVRKQWRSLISDLQSASNKTNANETDTINERVARNTADNSNTSRSDLRRKAYSTTNPAKRPPAAQSPGPAVEQAGEALIAVVIPVRNRTGQCLRNTLASLNWQSTGRPAQVIVVSHGSYAEIDRELQGICAEQGADLITIGTSSQPWNKPLALNTGIRKTRSDLPFVMTMDADMILAPNFLAVVLERLRRQPPALVLCGSSDLPQHVVLPSDPADLRRAFDSLHQYARLRSHMGTGGVQAAARSFFFEIRGYDEDFLWWGAMDGDIVNRAQMMRLHIEWVEERTVMLHQWHPRKHSILQDAHDIEQAKRCWERNHVLVRSRAHTPHRNPQSWGGNST